MVERYGLWKKVIFPAKTILFPCAARSSVPSLPMHKRFLMVCGLAACLFHGSPSFAQDEAAEEEMPPDAPSASIPEPEDSPYKTVLVLARALELIRQDYVDGSQVSYRDLLYGAMRGMLSSLDPHSQFMEPAGFEEMKNDTESQFGGLGIEISTKNDILTIVTPMEGGPGAKAGLMPNDQIIKIDGQSTEKMSVADSVAKLRGKPGEKIVLTIARPATKEVKEFTIQRDVIHYDTVKDATVLDMELTGDFKIGYVRVLQFAEPTASELAEKLDKLESEGIEALILDLRNNPGGLLNSAVDVCGEFLPPNTMVVFTDGRTESSRRYFRTAAKTKKDRKYPVAVLINHNSASGSEIVAGALKDLNRAVLVGETTFGKGSVQSVLPLPDGSAMRFTTAKYYTPGKQVIHEHGVAPHIRSTLSPEAEGALFSRRNTANLTAQEKRDLARFKDTQLDRAVDALKGVMIFSAKKEAPPVEGKNQG